MKRLKTFFINTLILVFSSICLRIIAMFFNVYISNQVGQEALGVFQLILSVYLFGITFACSGINIAATKVIAEELAIGNETSVKQITKRCITISLITGLLASCILCLFADILTTSCLHNKVSKHILYCICFALPFIAMSSAINGYFTAIRKVYKNALNRFLEQFVKIGVTYYLLSLFLPSGLESACYCLILGDVLSEIASFLFYYVLYRIEKNRQYRSIKSITYTKRILRVSLPVAFASYIRSGLSTLKQVLIPARLEKSGLSCSVSLSRYGVVTGMVMPVLLFPCVFIDSFSGLLIPEFSRYYAKQDFRRARQITKFLLVLVALFSLFLILLFLLFAEDFAVFLYHDSSIGFYIQLLSPLILFMYIDIVMDSILKGLNEQVNVMLVNVIDLMVSVVFIYFFVPQLGFVRLYHVYLY